MPLKVLVVTNMFPSESHPSDGIFVKRQIDALREASKDLEIRICHLDTIRHKWLYALGGIKVLSAVREFKPHLVHIHYGLSQLMAWPAFGIPVVVTMHGSDLTIPWQRRISASLLRKNHTPVVVSASLKQYLADRQDLRVISCGVRASSFNLDKSQCRDDLSISRDATLVLFGANPARQVKRHDRFCAALELVNRDLPNVQSMCLSEVPVSLAPKLIASADVLVLTSDREGSPVVTKEALCAGVRVVSTPVGDVDGQISGFSGCAVATMDPDSIAKSIASVLREPVPDATLARLRFDTSVEARELLRLYQLMASS